MMRVGLVLAAGRSCRFGEMDKLLAPFRGMALAGWPAEAMLGVPLDHRIVVTDSPEIAEHFHGFEVLAGAGPDAGQADTLKVGVARAAELGADRLLVALADMPLVRHGVLSEVLSACGSDHASAVTDGRRRMPPACFPAAMFGALRALTGDRGAGHLLTDIPEAALVTVAPRMLADVDTEADLLTLEEG